MGNKKIEERTNRKGPTTIYIPRDIKQNMHTKIIIKSQIEIVILTDIISIGGSVSSERVPERFLYLQSVFVVF